MKTANSAATQKTNISSQPCTKGKEDRTSDLCAQWMAVDAARQQAIASNKAVDIGWFGVLLGFATLFVAIYAAFQAKRAATAAINQANDAAAEANEQRTARERQFAIQAQENRAKLRIEGSPSLSLPNQPNTYFQFSIRNDGLSLASNLTLSISMNCNNPTDQSVVTSDAVERQVANLLPNQSHQISAPITYPFEEVVAFGNTWFPAEVEIEIKWHDAYGFSVLDTWKCAGSSCVGAMPSPLEPVLHSHLAQAL